MAFDHPANDPVVPVAGTDTTTNAFLVKTNPSLQKRHWLAITVITDADPAITDDTELLVVNSVATAVNVVLPDAATHSGQRFWIYADQATPTFTVTATAAGSDTVGGSATQVLDADGEYLELVCNGETVDWIILGDNR